MRKTKLQYLLMVVLCLGMFFSSTVYASALSNDAEMVQKISRLESLIEKYNSDKTYVQIDWTKVSEENLAFMEDFSDEDLENYIHSLYVDAENVKTTVVGVSAEPAIAPHIHDRPWTTYDRSADVFAGIPNIGVCWIRIYYHATLSKDLYFMDGDVYNSKQVGVAVGSWDHVTGGFDISYYKTSADVTATGILTYGIPDTILSVSTEQTFLYTDSYRNYEQ